MMEKTVWRVRHLHLANSITNTATLWTDGGRGMLAGESRLY